MTSQAAEFLEVQGPVGVGLRIQFLWCGDRFAHTIAAVRGPRLLPLLASVEGSSEDRWPTSPPLQSIQVEEREGSGRTLLLLGMAGSSHWSLSAQAWQAGGIARNASDPAAIELDVACRIGEPPGWIGSSYRTMVAAEGRLVDATGLGPSLDLHAFDVRCRITIVEQGGFPVELSSTPDRVAVTIPVVTAEVPSTARWKYVVSLSAG